jgi:hypothetical protein
MPQTIQFSNLILGDQLGVGTQGKVFEVNSASPAGFPVVYKEFIKRLKGGGGLNRLFSFRDGLDQASRDFLDDRLTWPLFPVYDGNHFSGYLMKRVPKEFLIDFISPTGHKKKFCTHQLLLKSDDIFRESHGFSVAREVRLHLALDLARIYAFLHRNRLIYGDMNWLNALWTLNPQPAMLILDCDPVRLEGTQPAFDQLHSDGWMPPEKKKGLIRNPPQTFHTDRWKLAVAILRLLSPTRGNFNVTQRVGTHDADYDSLRDWIKSPEITSLLEAALKDGLPSTTRPEPVHWIKALLKEVKLQRGPISFPYPCEKVNSVTDHSDPFEVFEQALISPTATPSTLLSLLSKVPVTVRSRPVQGFNIPDLKSKLSTLEKTWKQLEKLGTKKDRPPFTYKVESEIATLVSPHIDLLVFPWANRYREAYNRILEWNEIDKLLKSKATEEAIILQAENSNYLDGFQQFIKLQPDLQRWKNDLNILDQFVAAAKNPQTTERELLSIWQQSSSLNQLQTASSYNSSLGKSPVDRVILAEKRIHAIDQMRALAEHKAGGRATKKSEEAIVTAWGQVAAIIGKIADPEVKKLQNRIEVAQRRLKNFPLLVQAIKDNPRDDETILNHSENGDLFTDFEPAYNYKGQNLINLVKQSKRRKECVYEFIRIHGTNEPDELELAKIWNQNLELKDSLISQTTAISYAGRQISIVDRGKLAANRSQAYATLQSLVDSQKQNNYSTIQKEQEIAACWRDNEALLEGWPRAKKEFGNRVETARQRCREAKALKLTLDEKNGSPVLTVSSF